MPVHSTIKADYPIESADCRRCERLATFLDAVKTRYPDYHARPVSAFGDSHAKLLIVGLAPGMHGANRTGRPFTGDFAGVLLYQTLYKFGFANHDESISQQDNLQLSNCSITNAVKCLPPQNKPNPEEIRQCNHYLKMEVNAFMDRGGEVLLALGAIAHRAVLRSLDLRLKDYPFAHGAEYLLPNHSAMGPVKLYDSYHCSRYNTQTKRLTAAMFEEVFARISVELSAAD
ncbi:uracil-DNA glycosylase [Nitrosomonas aestuarii]|uniref:uracil-DNA glycosylase n=1 Tax=Nitrosomonas aestuarii TaxID=52441 RepID=UPI000D327DCB|nr:uracil-DNA glycosylase [Nitrosomonas aestuarii]PTN12371.1 uracil-DNA glycosylase family 4 [Nitrosomonas aestuarii]